MKFPQLFATFLTAITLSNTANSAPAPKPPVKVVENFNIEQYKGTWFEIARTDNWFQKSCMKNTMANYSQNSDGTIRVDNTCITFKGKTKQAIGIAKVQEPAKLKVSFAPRFTHFLDFVWADYWVIDLDKNYTLAAVSDPNRKYLWILSRSPKPNPKEYESLLTRLEQSGFDTKALIKTKQESAD